MTEEYSELVAQALEIGAKNLTSSGKLEKYSIDTKDGLRLDLVLIGGRAASISTTPTREVFFLTLGSYHLSPQTAYDDAAKKNILADMFRYVETYIHGDFREEVLEKSGSKVPVILRLQANEGDIKLTALSPFGVLAKRLAGYKRRTIHVDDKQK